MVFSLTYTHFSLQISTHLYSLDSYYNDTQTETSITGNTFPPAAQHLYIPELILFPKTHHVILKSSSSLFVAAVCF